MTFNFLLFATLKDKIGKNQISLHAGEPASLADLLSVLYREYPQLEPYKNSILVAVNQKFASADQPVHAEDEIALFPPVSGG